MMRICVMALVAIGFVGCGSDEDPATSVDGGGSTDGGTTTGEPGPDATGGEQDTGEQTDPMAGLRARIQPDGTALFDMPFPTDLRLVDGQLDLSGFPNPNAVNLIQQYVAAAEELVHGFSLTPSIVFRFEGAINTASITATNASWKFDSNVILVNIDPDSDAFGTRTPVHFWWWGEDSASYLTPNTLTLQPLFGTPLKEATTYACLVLRTITDPVGEPLGQHPLITSGLEGAGPLGDTLAPLVAWLPNASDVEPSNIAVATVFTTGSPTSGLRDIASFVQHEATAPVVTDLALSTIELNQPGGHTGAFDVYEGHYQSPNFQSGEKPYVEAGGNIVFADGMPTIQEWEPLRFAMAVPKGSCVMPEAGWPIVMYGHGTGGDWKSFMGGSPFSPATQLAQNPWCMAVLGIDQPLHGTRYEGSQGGEIINSFNFFNVRAARSNFRQSAIDVLYLSRLLQGGLVVAADKTRDGAEIRFDPAHVFFFGHSHGGLSGGLFAPFIEGVRGIVLSGAGGGLSETTVRRKDLLNIKALLNAALYIENTDELTVSHPAIALMQNLVDITDPLTYAPLYLRPGLDSNGVERPPLNILITEGTQDAQTPGITTDNLAAAAEIPILAPAAQQSEAHGVLGLAPISKPVSENYVFGDRKGTAVLAQFSNADHFAVFDEISAVKLYTGFFRSIVDDGTPTIK